MSLKRTPLYAVHVAAGAKMVDFGGWAEADEPTCPAACRPADAARPASRAVPAAGQRRCFEGGSA